MSKKDLKLSNCNVPNLLLLYQDVHKNIYKKTVYIRDEKIIERFRKFQIRLMKEDISIMDYAENALILAKDWMISKKVTIVPPNVFMGEWLYNKYKKLKQQKSVRLYHKNDAKIEDPLYIDERLVAFHYISAYSSKKCKFDDVVLELESLLSEEWKSLYFAGKLRNYTTIVLNELEVHYDKSATSYRNLAEQLIGDH